ncbi:DUF3142 domain-containing protein, partial [Psychrobacter celer]
MSNYLQKYQRFTFKRWMLGLLGLGIIMFAALVYYQGTSRFSSAPSKQITQIPPQDSDASKIGSITMPTNTTNIQANDYQQFWLWTPPKDSTKLSQAHTLYLLQGEIRAPNMPYYRPDTHDNNAQALPATLITQGLGVRPLRGKKMWLVYRATSQTWSEDVMPQLIKRLEQWQRAGNHVMGIQIDYDAPTYRLGEYAALLKQIRQQLPAQYQLSVTGLLDWSNQAEDSQFIQLNDAIDELVIQTYQGTTTLTNYAQHLIRLKDLPFDFKV